MRFTKTTSLLLHNSEERFVTLNPDLQIGMPKDSGKPLTNITGKNTLLSVHLLMLPNHSKTVSLKQLSEFVKDKLKDKLHLEMIF